MTSFGIHSADYYPKRDIAQLRLVLRILKSMTSGLEVFVYEKKLSS